MGTIRTDGGAGVPGADEGASVASAVEAICWVRLNLAEQDGRGRGFSASEGVTGAAPCASALKPPSRGGGGGSIFILLASPYTLHTSSRTAGRFKFDPSTSGSELVASADIHICMVLTHLKY